MRTACGAKRCPHALRGKRFVKILAFAFGPAGPARVWGPVVMSSRRRHSLTSLTAAHKPEDVDRRASSRRSSRLSGPRTSAPGLLAVLSCLGEGSASEPAPARGGAGSAPGDMVLPVLPSATYDMAARVLAGRKVTGIIGRQDWARGVAQVCSLTGPFTLNRDEPHFALDLPDLHLPEGTGQIVPLSQAPADTIKSWIHAYMIEALDTPKTQADTEVFTRYDRYVAANSHVVLMDGSAPLAMCGFNARLPLIVQVGGVYTPPALRGQGHARRAIGQHLAKARAAGVQRAVLFSASEQASNTYRALGFSQIGQWTLLLQANPQVIRD